MSALKEQLRLLGQFLQSDFRRTLWGCALILTAAVALGAVLGLLSPEAVDMVLAQFMAMVEESGVIDSAGNLSPFGLLTNNWTAMLVAVLYGFIPFLYLPALTLASNGLLVGAETWCGDELVMRMSSEPVEMPAPSGTAFALPDGSVLHTVEG